MGSDENHFNVSLIVRNKVTRQCPQTTTFEEKGQPKQIRTEVPLTEALPLGQTGSQDSVHRTQLFEEKGEPKRIRTEVLPLTILTPYR